MVLMDPLMILKLKDVWNNATFNVWTLFLGRFINQTIGLFMREKMFCTNPEEPLTVALCLMQ